MNKIKEGVKERYNEIRYGLCDNCYPNHNKQTLGEVFYENGVWSFYCLTCSYISYNKLESNKALIKELVEACKWALDFIENLPFDLKLQLATKRHAPIDTTLLEQAIKRAESIK